MHNLKKDFPAFHRNIEPLTTKLGEILDTSPMKVLEIGSGSGQHAVSFAKVFNNLDIQPTDIEEENILSINAWIEETGVENVHDAQLLDVTQNTLPFSDEEKFDLFLCFNVIHITPWFVTEQLFKMAERVASPKAKVMLYGPFRIDGKHISESNEQFEVWLKSKDERFGVRDLDEVHTVAKNSGFVGLVKHQMPANNFLIEFTRA